MNARDLMTPGQREALERAYSALGEQFEGIVILVNFEHSDDGINSEVHEGYWKGGSMNALGLCEFARDRILNSNRKEIEP